MPTSTKKQNPKIQRQAGYFMVGMSVAMLAAAIFTIGVARTSLNTWKKDIGTSIGNQLQTVDTALVAYIAANSTNLIANTAIAIPSGGNVANIYTPTIAELKSLGYLNNAVQTTPTRGTAYKIKITLQPTGCTTTCSPVGYVYLQDPIYGPDGKTADIGLLVPAMSASGTSQIGFSVSNGVTATSTTITGNGWSFANPDPAQRAGILYATTNLSGSTTTTGSSTQYWLQSAATSSALPTSGNILGDGRLAQDTNKPYAWTGTAWRELFSSTDGTSLSLGANSGPISNWNNNTFIGGGSGAGGGGWNNVFTGYQSGYKTNGGGQNVFSGMQAGYSNTSGSDNVFIGSSAGWSNSTASGNVFLGSFAGNQNKTGSGNIFAGQQSGEKNNTGLNNSFFGAYSGQSNTTGSNNVFSGHSAGWSNTTGSSNVFSGMRAGYFNTTGNSNVFSGDSAGWSNTTGSSNVFSGTSAGWSNTTGSSNVFTGAGTGQSNTTGWSNVFSGSGAGNSNTTGYYNVFSGMRAGYFNTTGSLNTAFGGFADFASPNFTNASAFGYQALAPASNSVRIGNTSVSLIGGQVGWSNLSDRRLKTDIKDSARGLDFVRKLRPVDYILKDNKKAETGFIAQEVEEIDSKFPGVNKPANDKGFYSLTYTDFIPSMVKAIQELDARNSGTALASDQKQAGTIKYLRFAVIALVMFCVLLFGMLLRVMGQIDQIKRQIGEPVAR